jgi:flagellin
MVINTNMAAIMSANNLDNSTNQLNSALSELSSGSKIVNPATDPAGLAESLELNAQVGQTNAGNNNVSNALSFLQTQDGYLTQVGAALNQMSTLAVEAQDPTKTTTELSDYNAEFQTLAGFINNAGQSTFNGVSLFGGSALSVVDGNGDTISTTGITMGSGSAYDMTGSNLTTGAAAAATAVSAAITTLSSAQATNGATEDELNYTGAELGVLSDNLTAANSNIADVDVATESTKYAEYQVLVQSGTAMLAQANQNPDSVLKLLS